MSNDRRALLYALSAVVFWSTVATAFKIALRYLDVFQLLLVASTTSAVLLLLVVALRRQLGLMLAYMVPAIEKHGAWFALACVGIAGMGVGRLLSSLEFEPAPANSGGAMVAEFVMPPLLIVWQRFVARAHGMTV